MKLLLCALLCVSTAIANIAAAGQAIVTVEGYGSTRVPITSWKERRDARIVKQNLDFSCGAASMATVLDEFYGQHVTEAQLLKAMGKEYNPKLSKEEQQASFDDMQRALPKFGFAAIGYAANYDDLVQLKIPVIVYLKHRKDTHFSVLRGISADGAWLADPALGNRTYSRSQFLKLWETRMDEKDNNQLKGKILAILPLSEIPNATNFFTKPFQRPTDLTLRSIPMSDQTKMSIRNVQKFTLW